MAVLTALKTAYEVGKAIVKQIQQGCDYVNGLQITVGSDEYADLLYVLQNGDPARNIPPRPAVSIGMDSFKSKVSVESHAVVATAQAIFGNRAGAKAQMQKAADQVAQNVRDVFGSGQLAPNAPSTIAKKGFNAPLIDTGALMESITGTVQGG